jgi:hypothetical protein
MIQFKARGNVLQTFSLNILLLDRKWAMSTEKVVIRWKENLTV